MGSGVAKWLRRCGTSRTVPGSIPGGVIVEFFRGSFPQNHLPWGRLSFWKCVPGISPGIKAVGAYGWRPTTLVVPKVEMIRGLNLPGTPRATSVCRGTPLTFKSNNSNCCDFPRSSAIYLRSMIQKTGEREPLCPISYIYLVLWHMKT
jgi:hypothetical protein